MDKQFVKMEVLENYINACNKDADERNLLVGKVFFALNMYIII